jgi:hypothetical protein
MILRGRVPGAALVPRLPRAVIFRPFRTLGFGSLRSHRDRGRPRRDSGCRTEDRESIKSWISELPAKVVGKSLGEIEQILRTQIASLFSNFGASIKSSFQKEPHFTK